MQIEKREVRKLAFDPNNARTHNEKNLAAIKGSLAKFGQQKPIVIDKSNVVIAGNGTLQAAKELGWEVIDVVVTSLDKFDKTAFALADNRTSELAEWDGINLEKQLQALKGIDFDISDIGFDDFSFEDDVSNSEPSEKDDIVPEVDENPYNVKLGDIWQLGNHRLMCGDSTDKEQVDKLMNGEKADMVFTDPPYALTGGGCKGNFVNSGYMSPDKFKDNAKSNLFEVPEFKEWIKLLPDILVNDFSIFCMSNNRNLKPIINELEKIKCKMHNILIMKKDTGFPHIWYTPRHEFILYFYAGKAIKPVNKMQSSVFDVVMPKGDEKSHVSQKPVSMISEILLNHPFKLIFEPFSGSGSTLIACQKTNRRCFGLEIDPHYCSVIIKRWEDFTGQKASKL